MNVLLVTEDLPVANLGGAGKHAVLLGNALIAAGHQVEMLGRLRAEGYGGNNGFEGLLHATIDLRGTGWQEFRSGAFIPGRREHAAYRVWRAIRKLGVDRFDVVHYHGHLTALGTFVPESVPFVQTLHDQGSECLTMTRFRRGQVCRDMDPRACAGCATARPNVVQRWLSAAAARRLRRKSAESFSRHETIFVSEFLRSRFVANVRPSTPLRAHVIHNFTDAAALAAARTDLTAQSHDRRPLALMVGRIDAAKGFGAFLDALPDLVLSAWKLRVLGDGPERAALERHHACRGVEFAGHQDLATVYRETENAALCIVPSTCEEACSTTLLEALALGRPTLALARGGSPELVRFERYPGQLMLVESIPDMIEALATWPLAGAGCRSMPGVGQAADVRQRLPELFAVYRAAGPARMASAGQCRASRTEP